MNVMAGSSSSAEEAHSSGGEQPAESCLGNASASSYVQQNPSPPAASELQLPLPSSRLEVKPAESHEKVIMTSYIPPGHSCSRVHRPVATQPDQATALLPAATGGAGPPPAPPGGGGGAGGFSVALHNSVFQGSAPTQQLSGFTPFPYTADHALRPQMQQLMTSQAASAQGHINIGVTIPVKSVPAVTTSATLIVNPFNGVDAAGQCINDARDKSTDNAFVVTINERRVKLSNTGSDSLYALCRRWIRNDIPRKDQHVPWDSVRPLPRPLSAGVAESSKDKSTEDAKEEGTKTEIGSEALFLEEPIENISKHQLLQAHVKHAKSVRARLRAERMQRIGRFKQRLALLLPSSMDQNKSNSAVPS